MALFYQHNIHEDAKLGTWKIEENEAFFLQRVPLKQDVSHPYKRLQHLAGRYLLTELYEDFPLEEILIADTKKPFLQEEQYHFSISHCGIFAAAIASPTNRVGVDIEFVTPRIQGISKKFLHPVELEFLNSYDYMKSIYLELLTATWSAKEAIFKWYGYGQVDFSNHIQLQTPVAIEPNEWMVLPFKFLKDGEQDLTVHARVTDGVSLAYVIS